MIRRFCIVLSLLFVTDAMAIQPSPHQLEPSISLRFEALLVAQKRSCKAVSSCEEAVQMWCDGYSRADADKDGIPCENVCSSKAEVDAIKAQIGC